jgi:aspartate carbamoyltransferase regulatory subunit
MAAAKKTNETEQVIGAAAASFNKAATNLQDAIKSIAGLVENSENLSREIAAKQSDIAQLNSDYTVKSRQAEIDFNLSLQETKDKTVTEYLKSVGKEAVESAAYKALQTDLAKSISERDTEVKKAVAIENSRLTKEHAAEIALFESQHQTATVKQTAQIEALQKENANLTAQVAQLFKQIDSERAAGIERAKASAIGNVNFPTPNGR